MQGEKVKIQGISCLLFEGARIVGPKPEYRHPDDHCYVQCTTCGTIAPTDDCGPVYRKDQPVYMECSMCSEAQLAAARTGKLVHYNRDYPIIYKARHSEDDMSFPATLEESVVVNFWGVVLAEKELPKNKYGAVEVSEIEMEDGTFREPWVEDEMEDEAVEVVTEDGYRFRKDEEGMWTDGDLEYGSLATLGVEYEIVEYITD